MHNCYLYNQNCIDNDLWDELIQFCTYNTTMLTLRAHTTIIFNADCCAQSFSIPNAIYAKGIEGLRARSRQ